MSPTIAMRQPSSEGPRCRRSVNASSSAWVGCSWHPSPALITRAELHDATRCGAPAAAWRTTIASTPIASIVCTVSSRLSPFFTDDVDTENVIVSAESRLAPRSRTTAACGSSPRRTATRPSCPARPGTFGMSRCVTSRNESVRSSIDSMPARPPRSSTESRCFIIDLVPPARAHPRGRRRRRRRPRPVAPARPRSSGSAGSCRRSRRATAARDGRGRRAPRAAPRGRPSSSSASSAAGGAAGEQHVVDEHDDLARDVGDLGRPERRDRAQPDVVAVERDVEAPSVGSTASKDAIADASRRASATPRCRGRRGRRRRRRDCVRRSRARSGSAPGGDRRRRTRGCVTAPDRGRRSAVTVPNAAGTRRSRASRSPAC